MNKKQRKILYMIGQGLYQGLLITLAFVSADLLYEFSQLTDLRHLGFEKGFITLNHIPVGLNIKSWAIGFSFLAAIIGYTSK